MESEKFDLVFKGQLLPKRALEEVKVNLGALFKISAAQVEGLFSGKPVVLKRNIDLTAANRYRIALKNAGARVDLVKAGVTVSASTPQDSSVSAPRADVSVKLPVLASEAVSSQSDNALTLREAGYLLAPEERKPDAVRDIDLSAFSLREGGNLVDAAEVERLEPITIEDLMAELMPVGSRLVDASDDQPAITVRVLDAEVAPVGVRLAPESKVNAVAPNVDHLSLAK